MNTTASIENNQEKINYPWLLFRLQDNYFAINSRRVTGIMIRPDEMTQLPESPDFVRGLIMLRGSIVRLLDLRLLFSMESTESQCENFQFSIESHKQEHLAWVAELERSVAEGEPFMLETDPTQSSFGRWHETYHPDQPNIANHLDKTDVPHCKIYEVAQKLTSMLGEGCDPSDPSIITAMAELHSKSKQFVKFLEESTALFSDNLREMAIVVEEEDRRLGLIVDQVLSVEDLSMEDLDDRGVNFFHDLTYVKGVCKSRNVEGNILVINDDELLKLTSGDGNLDEIHVESI